MKINSLVRCFSRNAFNCSVEICSIEGKVVTLPQWNTNFVIYRSFQLINK